MKEDSELILENEVKQNSWKMRPCTFYKEEYKECRSIKGRFQQYFVNGDILDCSSWQHDLNDCINFEEKGDFRSAKRVIDNENLRRKERMQGHWENDVWKKRSKPPDDFNKPLPDFITKRYENSYLEAKSKEMKGEALPDTIKEATYCTLM
ncbi:hypothetical protein PVAND_006128 [Polypedilum vanderplanki]|uniref:Synaptic plasticity regulator PANTS n=1 Tax=Polypedilum vanderplanki TaxID=319348 RepID=A0A9J6C329_POLVA|nr:hypothetical protein PVAND_006128 [Polypedilum vanderplanki]